jgi:DNA-binding CsgD family transcriptional regulator
VPHAYAIAHSLTLNSRNRLAERLTRREVDVLAHLGEGETYRQAAAALGIAVPTVQTLAHRAYQKLNATGRHEALQEARRLGVL